VGLLNFIMVDAQSCLILLGTNFPEPFYKQIDFLLKPMLDLYLHYHNVVEFDCIFTIHFNCPKYFVIDALDE